MGYHILKTMLVKIEIKNSGTKFIPREEIALGFIHDSVKNFFLVESINEEFELGDNSKVLSSKYIINDNNLV